MKTLATCDCRMLPGFVSTPLSLETRINSGLLQTCENIHRKSFMGCFHPRCALKRRASVQTWKMLSPSVLEKKQTLVREVNELLQRSSVIVSFPTEGYTHKELSDLRRRLAETKIKVVKNTLMKRAIQGTPFQALQSDLRGTNAWLFLPEDFKPSIQELETANQENKKEVAFRYGVIDTYVFSGDELKEVLQLPSKKELIAQIAFAIQSVHTQLAASIHQVPTKLARAIHLAKGLDEKKESESSE
ncbi:hypothetical protein GpartN1_g6803.t1 [Galdieria partita]|uniref:50S ribosomal protein L10 n=1 Tax=Galdieria partita TaxID=83374 RepID=A0A9C7Q4J0_9RHOD|nr:hypothetical protein GpartN1_g6803.t1 [Galdieria partita]